MIFLLGSPPPMRGKVAEGIRDGSGERITPAYAGKRLCIFTAAKSLRDHPRLCGEKKMIQQLYRFLYGSPPPMRGKALGDVAV